MEFNEFKDLVFSRGSRAGFTDMEIYHQSSKDLSIKVFEGEVDSYTLAEAGGYSSGACISNMAMPTRSPGRGQWTSWLGRPKAEVIDDEQLEIRRPQRYPEISV